MRGGSTALMVLVLFSSALSGCLMEGLNAEAEAPDDTEGDAPVVTQDGLFSCIEHDGLERCWQMHVPEGLDPDEPVPLVVDLHGYSSTSSSHKLLSSFDVIADEEGAIIVYPDAVPGYNLPTDTQENQAWNAGWCCAHASRENIDDVGFIAQVVNLTLESHNVDATRVYASGWSNGCAMVQRLAMDLSHVFAAVGCMAHYLIHDASEDYSPIPVMEVHGFLDPVVLYETSVLSLPWAEDMWTNPETVDTGAIENLHEWASHNGCTGSMEAFEVNSLYAIHGFDTCENDATVQLMTVFGAQHNPYENDNDDGTLIGNVYIGTQGLVKTSHIVWDFLIQHSKDAVDEA